MLSLATMAGQGITFAALPVITRLYEPSVYGNYQVLYAAVTVVGVIASLRLERAIPLPTDEVGARAVAVGAYGVTLTTMGLLAVLCFLAPETVAGALGNRDVASAIWVVPVGAALTSGYIIATQWAIRVRRHGPIAVRNAAQPAVTAIAQVVLGAIMPTVAALNAGLLTGRFIGATSAIRELLRPGPRPTWNLVRSQLRRYRAFMFLSAPSALLNAVALQLPVLLIGALYGAASAGLYGVAALLTVAPVTLLAGAMSQVTMGSVSDRIRLGAPGVQGLIRKALVPTAVVSLASAALIAVTAELIATVLGPSWEDAAPFLMALSLVLAARLPATAISPVLSALERHKATLCLDALRTAAVLATLGYASHAGWSVQHALYLMAVVVAATYVAAIVVTVHGAGQHDAEMTHKEKA